MIMDANKIPEILGSMAHNYNRRENVIVVFTPYAMTCAQRVSPAMWHHVRDLRESFFVLIPPKRYNEIDITEFFTSMCELIQDVKII